MLKQSADLFGTHPQGQSQSGVVAGYAFETPGIFERLITKYQPFVFVFNTLNPACGWLGIDVADAQRTLGSLRTQARGTAKSAG